MSKYRSSPIETKFFGSSYIPRNFAFANEGSSGSFSTFYRCNSAAVIKLLESLLAANNKFSGLITSAEIAEVINKAFYLYKKKMFRYKVLSRAKKISTLAAS